MKSGRICINCNVNAVSRSTAAWCEPCAMATIDKNRGFLVPERRLDAQRMRLKSYPDFCGEHGETLFSTESGKCRMCDKFALPLSERAKARALGETFYQALCVEHGEAKHDVLRGKCQFCYNQNGTLRTVRFNPRADARRASQPYYKFSCVDHGYVDHYVTNGKCRLCCTTAGIRRAPYRGP